jgi:hypothetical protein
MADFRILLRAYPCEDDRSHKEDRQAEQRAVRAHSEPTYHCNLTRNVDEFDKRTCHRYNSSQVFLLNNDSDFAESTQSGNEVFGRRRVFE